VNFTTVRDAVDAIGGIDVTIDDEEMAAMNQIIWIMNQEVFAEPAYYDLLETSGEIHLNGKQALAYARDRTSARSDFDRTSRQRTMVQACMEQIRSLNPLQLLQAMEKIMPELVTDFTEQDLIRLLPVLLSFSSYSIEEFSIPQDGTYTSGYIGEQQALIIDAETNRQMWEDALNQ
jgi:anionic cell wall polymer biosynthesis LytR-Cps2A-Psr (LCP) family protein